MNEQNEQLEEQIREQIKIKKFKHKFLTRKVFIYQISSDKNNSRFLIASINTKEDLQRWLTKHKIHKQIATLEVTAPLIYWYTNKSDKLMKKIIENELGVSVDYINVLCKIDR
jgi:hypothetical protein